MDGHFGDNQAVLMAHANDLPLLSKLRKDTVIYEKYEGEYRGKGAKKKYGSRVRVDLMAVKYLKHSRREGELVRNYYQAICLHKEVGCPLNVVVVVQLNLKTKKLGEAVLFSSDLALNWEKLVD